MNDQHASYTLFRRSLTELTELSDDQWHSLQNIAHLQHYTKNQTILRAGTLSGYAWFISHGLVRNVYTTEEGKEFNKSFVSAPGFCGSMTEILTEQPSRFAIITLEPTSAIAIPLTWFRHATATQPNFQKLALSLAQQLALKKEQREAELLLDDATTRYLRFVTLFPDLDRRIAAYHIASYLGITEVALSRIKRQLNSATTN